MKKNNINLLVIILMAMGITSVTCFAAKIKYAQTGCQFLSVVSDAKASAMGEAMTSLNGGSTSLFFNPAGMANMQDKVVDIAFSLNSWIADIKHGTVSIAASPFDGRYGIVGLAVQYVDYGDDIQGTMVWPNGQGFVETEKLNASALAVGLGYAKMLNDRFSVGGQIKFVYQNLAKSTVSSIDDMNFYTKKNVVDGFAVDFGTLFKTGYKSLAFGMSVRNFSKEFKYEVESFQLPLLFTLGISMNLLDFDFMNFSESENQSLLLAIDATHPRAHQEQVKIGLDYRIMNVLSLRGGYITNNDEDGFSFGVGISYANVVLDYAYSPFGIFNNVQRVTARLSF
jgi:hypothetical protein